MTPLEDIKDSIATKGFFAAPWLYLQNGIFRPKTSGKTPQQELEGWCASEGLRAELFDDNNSRGRPERWVRIRKVTVGSPK